MQLYCFDSSQLKATQELLQIKHNGRVDFGIFSVIFDFIEREALTDTPLREFFVRNLLRSIPEHFDCFIENDAMIKYLLADISLFYEEFFNADWVKIFEKAQLIPLPEKLPPRSKRADTEYSALLKKMVKAEGSEQLLELVIEFRKSFFDEDEAVFTAFRWSFDGLEGIEHPDNIDFSGLCGIEFQKQSVIDNTRAFLSGKSANDILLTGSSGTGKSSLVKATLNAFSEEGLRLVELSRRELDCLPKLLLALRNRKKKYVLFIDDLTFEQADENYKWLKAALDGRVEQRAENVVIYATSNRRHLIRELWNERGTEDEIHEKDNLNEKLSLSERFGIHLFFPPLSQNEYFDIVEMHLNRAGLETDDSIKKQAAAWAIKYNGRSGRTAKQFVINYIGRQQDSNCGR